MLMHGTDQCHVIFLMIIKAVQPSNFGHGSFNMSSDTVSSWTLFEFLNSGKAVVYVWYVYIHMNIYYIYTCMYIYIFIYYT